MNNKNLIDNTPTIYILTISDRSFTGEREDLSGPAAVESIFNLTGWTCKQNIVVPDDTKNITDQLIKWIDYDKANLILTTGGTGLSTRDVTPEATLAIIDKQVPGIIEAIRSASMLITPYAMISRAIAGIRKQCLIINLPGNPNAVHEALAILAPVLPHALDIINSTNNVSNNHPRMP